MRSALNNPHYIRAHHDNGVKHKKESVSNDTLSL